MLNVKELWIGDDLRIKSSGRLGTFEGSVSSDMIRLKSLGKIYLISTKDVEIYNKNPDQEDFELPEFKEEIIFDSFKVSDTIDLHIEQLNPSLINALPERIVDYQTKAFENYFNQVKKQNKLSVTIVHGKGTGALKNIVHAIANSDPEVLNVREINSGGATEILFFKTAKS